VLTAAGRGFRADLLVAADGVHSRFRTAFFGHPGPRPAKKLAWRATLSAALVPRSTDMSSTGLWLGPGAHLVHYPVRGGESLNVVVIAGDTNASRPPQEIFGAAIRPLLDAVTEWTPWPLLTNDPTCPWVRGRAVLIGDAAHAMLPSAAQGGAQALEDAWVLAEALAERPDEVASALAAFERGRRPRVERIFREARRNLFIYNLGGIAAQMRNAAIKYLPAKFHVKRLDWLYSWQPAQNSFSRVGTP
jgi:salicylate hydroxylase